MMMGRRAFIAGLAAMPATGTSVLLPSNPRVTTRSAWDALIHDGLYLPLLHSPIGSPASRLQFQAQMYALIGDEREAFRLMGRDSETRAPDLKGASATPALEAIRAAAKDRQIVMLNEAHHISRCRAFALEVALVLRDLGFTILTGEAMNNDGDPHVGRILDSGGPVTTDFGLYTDDPVYGSLLRQARDAGYRFATYESRDDQIGGRAGNERFFYREDSEAENFIANILDKDSKVKVFVYCGYAHIRKTPQDGTLWFAGRLKRKTGIDPLCIAQAYGVPPPVRSLESPGLSAVLDRFAPQEPVALTDGDGHPIELGHATDGSIDISVFHPRVDPVDGRSGWLARAPGRKAAHYRANPAKDGILQAVPATDSPIANLVPADQFPVRAGPQDVAFFLTPGRYDIRLEFDGGRKILDRISV